MADFPFTVEGDGPLVVFSYGLGKVAWGDLTQLKQHNTVAVIDWFSAEIDRMVQLSHSWFKPFVEELGFDKAALCTWSMGSPAAIRFAASNPAELSRLILIDPAGLGGKPSRPPLRSIHHSVISKYRGRPTHGYVRMLWKIWVKNPAVDTRHLEQAHYEFWTRPGVFARNSKAISDVVATPLTDLLPNIEVPTLLLTGRHSTVLGPDLAGAAAAKLKKGRLEIFEDSAHGLQLEEPELFNKVTIDFLQETAE